MKKLTLLFLSVSFSLLLIILVFNILVNPFGIFESTYILNEKWKPEQVSKTRYTKALILMKKQPDCLILGNSRTEYGLNPNHNFFKECDNAYNSAFSSQSIYESFLYLKHSNEISKLKKVVISIDFDGFNLATQNDLDKTILCQEKNDCSPYFTLIKNLLSYEHIKSSFKTLFNNEITRFNHLSNGQRDFYHNNYFIEKEGGYDNAFNKFENHVSKLYKNTEAVIDNSAIQVYKDILNYAYENKIELNFVISPIHVRLVELKDSVRKNGQYKLWQKWKKELVNINTEFAKLKLIQPFKIYDFSGYNRFTTELVKKDQYMEYYWDDSHYKSNLGDILLNRMTYNFMDNDFGKLINTANIDEFIKNDEIKRKLWIKSNSEQLENFINLNRLISASKNEKVYFNITKLKYNHLNDNYIVGKDPYIIFNIDNELDVSKYRFFGFKFKCEELQTEPNFRLFWHDKTNNWFTREYSIDKFIYKKDIDEVIFYTNNINWNISKNTNSFRIDLENYKACKKIYINDIFLMN